MTPLEAAIDIAARGQRVFPCDPTSKKPLVAKGFKAATTDEVEIRERWGEHPRAMIGMPTGVVSGVVVIDIDVAHGEDGEASLEALFAPHGGVPETYEVGTPSGGRHLYFKHPGEPLPNTAGKLGKGLDTRGDGGYVILPPSEAADGNRYTLTRQVEMLPLPQWLIERLRKPKQPERQQQQGACRSERWAKYGEAALKYACQTIGSAPEGTRNATLNEEAFAVFRLVAGNAIGHNSAYGQLFDAGLAAGLDQVEVRQTLDSALSAGLASPRYEGETLEDSHHYEQHSRHGDSNRNYGPRLVPHDRTRRSSYKGLMRSDTFVGSMSPPDYVVHGLLMRGGAYTLTGNAGHGKTLLAVLMAIRVASGEWFLGAKCRKGKVAFFAGETPDNVKLQFYATCAECGVDPGELDILWHEGVFSISGAMEQLKSDLIRHPDLVLVVFDSLQAFFEGDDDNNNMATRDFAVSVRELVGCHPKRPAALIIAHPVKRATKDNLVPRGGSALTNELDGNLTAWTEHGLGELHWQAKFRGAPFDAIRFEVAQTKPDGLVDSDGELISVAVVRLLGEQRRGELMAKVNENEIRVLAALDGAAGISKNALATSLGMTRRHVDRAIEANKKSGLIKLYAGKWAVTREGKKALELHGYNQKKQHTEW